MGNTPANAHDRDNPRRFAQAHAIAISGDTLFVADAGNRRVLAFGIDSWELRDVWNFAWPVRPVDIVCHRGEAFVLSADAVFVLASSCEPRVVLSRVFGGAAWQRMAFDNRGLLYLLAPAFAFAPAELHVWDLKPRARFVGTIREAASVRDRFPLPAIFSIPDESQPGLQYVLPASLTMPCHRTRPALQTGQTVEDYFTRVPDSRDSGFVFNASGARVATDKVRVPQTALFRTGSQHESDGAWISKPLDSGTFDCRWDVVSLVFAQLPVGSVAEVTTYTANVSLLAADVEGLPPEAWALGIAVAGPPVAPRSATRVETDCLVDSPPGRYLWLRITFRADGFSTPVLEQATMRFPRRSYLEHLPAVFSEDEAGRRFLERFLAVFQTEWDGLESRADAVAGLFDPKAVPASHVDYLAEWLGHSLPANWTAAQKREILTRLPAISFGSRSGIGKPGGTRRGTPREIRDYLAAVLAATAGVKPEASGFPFVIDGYRERDYRLLPLTSDDGSLANADEARGAVLGDEGQDVVRDGAPLWGPAVMERFQLGVASELDSQRLLPAHAPELDVFTRHAHRFRVVLPAAWVPTPDAELALRRVIDSEKPAHTTYELNLVKPGLRVGVQSTVGVDTILGGSSPVLGEAETGGLRLGEGVLPPSGTNRAAQLDGRTRFGMDFPRM